MKKSLSIGLALLILIMTGISSVFVSADTSQTQLVDNCTGIAPEKAVYSNISITQRENMPEGWLGGWAKKDEDFANATAFYGSNDTEENLMTPGAARGYLTYEVAGTHITIKNLSSGWNTNIVGGSIPYDKTLQDVTWFPVWLDEGGRPWIYDNAYGHVWACYFAGVYSFQPPANVGSALTADPDKMIKPIQVEYSLDGENWISAETTITSILPNYTEKSDGTGYDIGTVMIETHEADLPDGVKKVRVSMDNISKTGEDAPFTNRWNTNIFKVAIDVSAAGDSEDDTTSDIVYDESLIRYTYIDDCKATAIGEAPALAEYTRMSIIKADEDELTGNILRGMSDGEKILKSMNHIYTVKDKLSANGTLTANSSRAYMTYDLKGAREVLIHNLSYYGTATSEQSWGYGRIYDGGTDHCITHEEGLKELWIDENGVLCFKNEEENGWRYYHDTNSWSFPLVENKVPEELQQMIQVEYTLDGENWILAENHLLKAVNSVHEGVNQPGTIEEYRAVLPEGVQKVRVSFDDMYAAYGGEINTTRRAIGIYKVEINGAADMSLEDMIKADSNNESVNSNPSDESKPDEDNQKPNEDNQKPNEDNEKPEEDNNNGKNDNSSADISVNTGSADPIVAIVLVAAAIVCMLVMVCSKKKA